MNSLVAVSTLTFLAVVLAAHSSAPPQAEAPDGIAPYLQPQHLVHVAGARTINLVCLGQGSPTVVLTAGLNGWSLVWNQVQPAVARRTRVCAWDPAGFGFSSSSPEPQDAIHKTRDLEQALKGADLNGPYVIVGHSAGAYTTLTFADQHRRTVVGMVLVDPAIPDEDAVRRRVAPKFAEFGGAAPTANLKRLRQCAAELKSATLKQGTPEFDRCTAQPLPPVFSNLSARLAQLNADSARLLTQASAFEIQSGIEVVNPKRNYGDMPMIVLTAGSHPMPPDLPADVREQAGLYFQTLASAHDAYAALSTRGRHETVPDSGHLIQLENPTAVIGAIDNVLAEIKQQSPNQSKRH